MFTREQQRGNLPTGPQQLMIMNIKINAKRCLNQAGEKSRKEEYCWMAAATAIYIA